MRFTGAWSVSEASALLILAGYCSAFSWGGGQRQMVLDWSAEQFMIDYPLLHDQESRLPNIYAVALNELQELQSEPLCHRNAARLLVNDCQLLEGKDDATILTDSGRRVRDFVDSYSASLAICDLERGNFAIPSSCSKFREGVLASLSPSKTSHLHVSPQEIDGCLSGLAKSDSAWNTWVSYRHKALRFCEAARSDNEKAQNVRLHQRLTEVLSKLTTGVEVDLDRHFSVIATKVSDVSHVLEYLQPQLDRLRAGLDSVEKSIANSLELSVENYGSAVRGGLEDAESLQQMLTVLLKTVLDSNAAVAASHEKTLDTFMQHTSREVSIVMTALSEVVSSTTALNEQLESSRLQALELDEKQTKLGQNLNQLSHVAGHLYSEYDAQASRLSRIQGQSNRILETLQEASASASTVQNSIYARTAWTLWWPHVIFPVASLWMGSYGLPPSAVRNFGLIALGEVAGMVVSFAKHASWKDTASVKSDFLSSNASTQGVAFISPSRGSHQT